MVEEPVSLAKVTMGWLTPPAFSPDDAALELATQCSARARRRACTASWW